MRKLLKGQDVTPRVMVTDKPRSCSTAKAMLILGVEHRSHKGLNNRAENSHLSVFNRSKLNTKDHFFTEMRYLASRSWLT
jgi:putative transposase